MCAERITVKVEVILSPKKAAAYLGITTMTLWRWVKSHKITPVILDHAYFHINELDRVKALQKKDDQTTEPEALKNAETGAG